MNIKLHYDVPGDDFTRAGEASGAVKRTLKQLGFPSDLIRRVSIAMYEAEINMVIHAGGGEADVEILPDRVSMVLTDHGPGIPDVEQARRASFTTGGAERSGMGFTIMESFMTSFDVTSAPGKGTTVHMRRKLQRKK